MDVGDAPDRRLGRCAFDTQIVEADPGELHGLHGYKEWHHRYGRIPSLDQKGGSGMIDGKHGNRSLLQFD